MIQNQQSHFSIKIGIKCPITMEEEIKDQSGFEKSKRNGSRKLSRKIRTEPIIKEQPSSLFSLKKNDS